MTDFFRVDECCECGIAFDPNKFKYIPAHSGYGGYYEGCYDRVCISNQEKKRKEDEYDREMNWVDNTCRWCGKKYAKKDSFASSRSTYCSQKCEFESKNSRK
jgi:hypothetical protein